MRGRLWKTAGAFVAPGLVVLALDPGPARADDNGFFGRLFRLGGSSSSSSNSPSFPGSPGDSGRSSSTSASNRSTGSLYGDIGSGGTFAPPASSPSRAPSPTPVSGPIGSEGPSTPDLGNSSDASPRLSPRPRVSSAVTTADPLITRLALGRSNDGSQFGMILQVFADGTAIDSEGVHHLTASDLRPLSEAIQNGDLYRVRGHCGTPSNDFIEYVHIVVFERRMGRLQAHSFSYAGNPQGCDNGIRYLHTALENIQAKLSRQPAPTASTSPGTATSSPAMAAAHSSPPVRGAGTAPPLPEPGQPAAAGSVIPLTTVPPR
jgi:hypothetical protein